MLFRIKVGGMIPGGSSVYIFLKRREET